MNRHRSLRLSFVACVAVALIANGSFGARAQGTPAAATTITGQLLDYQRGYVFFTTGDGFRVAPNVQLTDYATGAPTKLVPAPRIYARATFDAAGNVVRLDLSRGYLADAGDFAAVHRFAIALSTPAPNPDLVAQNPAGVKGYYRPPNGQPVVVTFVVQVPPTTSLTDNVYITTDSSGFNPMEIRMDRIDALHFRVTRRLNSGTILHYLYTRGSLISAERGENGLERIPRTLTVNNLDVQAITDTVYHWGDSTGSGRLLLPQTQPTPYNPSPFVTPHPNR